MFSPALHAARTRALRSQIFVARRLASSKDKSTQPVEYIAPQKPPRTGPSLAPFLERHPVLKKRFIVFAEWILRKSPKMLAGSTGESLYRSISDLHLQHHDFFYEECGLPPTFQTWFRITNLHAWLLVVRFRALPAAYGRIFIQALVSNFFLDVEDRMRDALAITPPGKTDPVPAPERVVTRYMKLYREQWNGLHFALDLALASPRDADAALAAAVWRNFLGGRGARGIDGLPPLPDEDLPELETGKGAIQPTPDADPAMPLERYAEFPRLMFALCRYVRQETLRLAAVPDVDVLTGNIGAFGAIDPVVDVDALPP